jgi:peptidoglycan/xylan/chitin deacetylase (PgdA/CDA1 family)
MRELIKNIYTNTLGSLYNPKSNTVVLNGHDFNMGNIKIDKKKEKVNNLLNKLSKGYKLLNLEEAIFNIEKNKKNSPQIAFTFDDGFFECAEIAEVFSAKKVSVGFFLSTGYHSNKKSELPLNKFKKPFLNEQDIVKIDNLGHIIGAHTHSHISLNSISKDNFYSEIIKPKKYIKDIINKDCNYFAPPYGTAELLSEDMLTEIQNEYKFIFWSNNKNLTSIERGGVNRRHFELNWSYNSLNYFLSKRK